MRRGRLLAGIAAGVLMLAGCGSKTGERLTEAEFKAKTDAICAAYTKRAEQELGSSNIDPTSPSTSPLELAQFSRLIGQVARLFGEQLDDLRAVRPPAEDARRYSEILRLYGQVESALGRAARAARKGDRRGLGELGSELDAVGRQVDALGLQCE
jgi:hypothetical protein